MGYSKPIVIPLRIRSRVRLGSTRQQSSLFIPTIRLDSWSNHNAHWHFDQFFRLFGKALAPIFLPLSLSRGPSFP